MILKDKTLQNAVSPTAKAGQKQEQDVAFFLRRAFKDHKQVFVINDFKFTHNNETAQIDHLIVYTYGFVLIESKSIKGEVQVNKQGEWARSIGEKWTGMPSPIKQVELQQKLLRELLHHHREGILSKLFGIRQQSFGKRCWHNLCAVSSNAIIERDSMPKEISNQITKSEFLVEKLNEIMKIKSAILHAINPFEVRPDFSDEELESITSFLMSQLSSNNIKEEPLKVVATEKATIVTDILPKLQCKSCGEKADYSARHGRYGYFIKCNKCENNTAMKIPCVSCNSKNTKVSKKKETYTLNCTSCDASVVLI